MKRALFLTLTFVLLLPRAPLAVSEDVVKAAFIREGNLWILLNGQEKQVTESAGLLSKPQWSKDGKWLAYQVAVPAKYQEDKTQSEVWVYNIDSNEKKKVFYNGYSPKWAPDKNHLAFGNGILNISDLNQFYNIATGVSDYTWIPDGTGFLLSSSGTLRPDGWSSASLFTKHVNHHYKDIVLFGGVEPFFTLPREIGTTVKNKLIAVYTEQLTYSPSGKWISFIVSPTASWSMDSNMLCVINSDGKKFEVLDEVILQVGKPKWAPSTDTIAFIAGGGRIVFGFKDKDLKTREMPVSGTFTPANYADLDFSWITNKLLVVSRIKEQEWSNDFSKHPLPMLYSVDIAKNRQLKITNPPKGYGDYSPQFIQSTKKLVWLRGSSLIDSKRDLWKANVDGTEATKWLQNVEDIVFYQ
ncbi:hypothetical protein WAK64_19720 [Bacillus spongiae]|uniref:TolB domain-containing protein n=1 Tax=Bacillus spongiae TaxID=2683610 RepID=A0ABU8HJL2_9BACI